MDRLIIDAIAEDHVLLRPDEVNRTPRRIADLEGHEGGDGLAQRGGMSHRRAKWPQCGERLALAEQHADIVALACQAGIVEDGQEGGIGNEGIRPQPVRRDPASCQHRVQLHAKLRQQAGKQHQRSRALQGDPGFSHCHRGHVLKSQQVSSKLH